jgi:type IV secretion system protein VirB5
VVVVHNWNIAWSESTDHGKAFLSDYARTNDPSKALNKRAVQVQITSVVRASANSFEVKWTEKVSAQDAVARTERWTAILTYLVAPPNDETKLKADPLGLYVDGINWSREFATDEQGG